MFKYKNFWRISMNDNKTVIRVDIARFRRGEPGRNCSWSLGNKALYHQNKRKKLYTKNNSEHKKFLQNLILKNLFREAKSGYYE